MNLPAPKREAKPLRQYSPKDPTRRFRYKVVAKWVHHPEWGDTDQIVAESRWHTLKLSGDCHRADLEGLTVDRDVTLSYEGRDGKTHTLRNTIAIPLDRQGDYIGVITLWDHTTERRAKQSAEGLHQRTLRRIERERAARVALTPVRDLIPRLG